MIHSELISEVVFTIDNCPLKDLLNYRVLIRINDTDAISPTKLLEWVPSARLVRGHSLTK